MTHPTMAHEKPRGTLAELTRSGCDRDFSLFQKAPLGPGRVSSELGSPKGGFVMPKGIYVRVVRPATERFWLNVEKTDTCWLWTGSIDAYGYGSFYLGGRQVRAHRYAYELLVGPIPEGLTIDHLCRVRRCVNPADLEPVTNRENILRGVSPAAIAAKKTHCPQGHPYDSVNTYVRPDGANERGCLICRSRWRERHAQRLAHNASVKRMELDEVTPHRCETKEDREEAS